MTPEAVNNVADYVLLSALIPLTLFVIRYFLFSPYHITSEGKNLMGIRLSQIVLVFAVLLSLFLGADYPFREWVRLLTFSGLAYFFWVDVYQLIRVQERHKWTRWLWLKKLLRR